MTTLRDIADELGVAVSVVSRALSSDPAKPAAVATDFIFFKNAGAKFLIIKSLNAMQCGNNSPELFFGGFFYALFKADRALRLPLRLLRNVCGF